MLRVLHIGLTSNPGGLESFVMNVYRNVDRTKIQFDFLSYAGTKLAYEDEIKSLGGKVYPIIYPRQNISRFTKPIIKFLKEKKYQIVHQHRTHLGDIDYLWMAKLAKVPVRILHAHSTGYMSPLNSLVKLTEKLNRTYLESVSTDLFACSNDAGKWMFGEHEFKLIRNAIDLESFTYNPDVRLDYREKLGIKNDELVIGHVGMFNPVKNQAFIVHLLSELLRSNSKYKVMLIGEGPLLESIQALVTQLGLEERVLLLGKRKDITALMNAMDLFVFPSLFEGLGIAAIEAQANGLPIILSNTVTKEVKFSSNVEFLSLEDMSEWTKTITHVDLERLDNTLLLEQAGYEIKEMADSLVKSYYNSLYI